jgi:hypothetical protein
MLQVQHSRWMRDASTVVVADVCCERGKLVWTEERLKLSVCSGLR